MNEEIVLILSPYEFVYTNHNNWYIYVNIKQNLSSTSCEDINEIMDDYLCKTLKEEQTIINRFKKMV